MELVEAAPERKRRWAESSHQAHAPLLLFTWSATEADWRERVSLQMKDVGLASFKL